MSRVIFSAVESAVLLVKEGSSQVQVYQQAHDLFESTANGRYHVQWLKVVTCGQVVARRSLMVRDRPLFFYAL